MHFLVPSWRVCIVCLLRVDDRSWDSLPSTAPTETEPGLGMAEFEARERAALSTAAQQDEEEVNQ